MDNPVDQRWTWRFYAGWGAAAMIALAAVGLTISRAHEPVPAEHNQAAQPAKAAETTPPEKPSAARNLKRNSADHRIANPNCGLSLPKKR
jgi:hypothetical protein